MAIQNSALNDKKREVGKLVIKAWEIWTESWNKNQEDYLQILANVDRCISRIKFNESKTHGDIFSILHMFLHLHRIILTGVGGRGVIFSCSRKEILYSESKSLIIKPNQNNLPSHLISAHPLCDQWNAFLSSHPTSWNLGSWHTLIVTGKKANKNIIWLMKQETNVGNQGS